MVNIAFPGLFKGEININPVAFSVFGLEVRWYGLLICIGIILTVMNTIRLAHKEGISTDDVLDFALVVVPMGIVGARVYYILSTLSSYDSFLDAIAIWNGGLAIYGGVIGGALGVLIVSKFKKISFLKMGDAVCGSIYIGQMIGRWGNFCNGEAFGTLRQWDFFGNIVATPNLVNDYFLRMEVSTYHEAVHPTFLYESIWNLIGFLLVTFVVYKRKKFNGQMILFYMGWYGFARMFLEGFRTDSLYIGNTGIRVSQLLALVTFLFAVGATVYVLTRKQDAKLADGEYVKQFSSASDKAEDIPASEEVSEEAAEKEADSAKASSEEQESKNIENTDTTEVTDNGTNN